MTAAIYARKSTEQAGVADEQKSVTRQVEHARAFAAAKGWAVHDDLIYVDDGISGAEFANRPGFLGLMNALKPRPAFQVLIMSEESRLGREEIETAYALKQIITSAVRVFFYLENRERTFDSPTDKLLLSVTAFADELEREKARQRTYDGTDRKAQECHRTDGYWRRRPPRFSQQRPARRRNAGFLHEVAFGERSPRPGLEVTLEGDRARFAAELNEATSSHGRRAAVCWDPPEL